MSAITIRALQQNDFPNWLPLWDANNMGRKNENLTTETWSRLMSDDAPVYGLCAIKQGDLAGILHYILHPITGSIDPACYMQDLFVDENHRKKGLARKMVQELTKIGRTEKWARIYWLAEADNTAAQALYKNLGVKLNFTLHVFPTQ